MMQWREGPAARTTNVGLSGWVLYGQRQNWSTKYIFKSSRTVRGMKKARWGRGRVGLIPQIVSHPWS